MDEHQEGVGSPVSQKGGSPKNVSRRGLIAAFVCLLIAYGLFQSILNVASQARNLQPLRTMLGDGPLPASNPFDLVEHNGTYDGVFAFLLTALLFAVRAFHPPIGVRRSIQLLVGGLMTGVGLFHLALIVYVRLKTGSLQSSFGVSPYAPIILLLGVALVGLLFLWRGLQDAPQKAQAAG